MFNKNKKSYFYMEGNVNKTILSFLQYMLDNYEYYTSKIEADFYSDDEKRNFIYNCAINTIDEYLELHSHCIDSYIALVSVRELFDANLMLTHFEPNGIRTKIPKRTKKLIDVFKFLKTSLSNEDKNYVMAEANYVLASTI